ncbi:unnamed protein product [Amoebophrya sp. A25]|nr:unnamed protein product [Amoebophrya sp. A25]|eukprot:GSA25T00023046001.1
MDVVGKMASRGLPLRMGSREFLVAFRSISHQTCRGPRPEVLKQAFLQDSLAHAEVLKQALATTPHPQHIAIRSSRRRSRDELLFMLSRRRALSSQAGKGGPQKDAATSTAATAATNPNEMIVDDRDEPKKDFRLTTEEADKYNRWSVFPKVFLVQIPTGAVYAWSMWAPDLCKSLGVVSAAALDWSLASVGMTFSSLAVGFGISVGLLGPTMEKYGARKSSFVGGLLFGGGHLVSALGCYYHFLPAIWLGWGFAGGLGWGLGYIPPIGLLVKWFPDRKGTATGAGIAAFASGGLFAAPMIEGLKTAFAKPPVSLPVGDLSILNTKVEEGRQWIQLAADTGLPNWHEVIQEGDFLYQVGTGETGCAGAFASLGLLYTLSMTLGSSTLKEPPVGWLPPAMRIAAQEAPTSVANSAGDGNTTKTSEQEASSSTALVDTSVSAQDAMKTSQFYLLWLTLACNASAGVCVISSAKLMMGDIFAAKFPAVVTTGFTTGFVGALSVANAGGRLVWASCSDIIGRKSTMFVTSLSLPACLLVPQITGMLGQPEVGNGALNLAAGATDPSLLPLYVFYGTTFAIVSWYGGVLALVPSYAADVFGTREVNVIYGRLMTGWSVSAIGTPGLLAYLRSVDERKAIENLVKQIPPEKFQERFAVNASPEALDTLIQAKAVTIKRLLEIAPEGVIDPTPFLYDTTFYSISGILAVAAVSNALIRKVK